MTTPSNTQKVTRRDLVERVAFARAEYELTYADREAGWQPLHVFVKDAAYQIAKHNQVDRITVTQSPYGTTFYARIDWKRLAADVAPTVARMKRQMGELDMLPEGVKS